ncbi:hypothetical protein CUS_4662 [Ruminococcus albus 8]|uniref:Uncharacterized protein n=1 Tax=Ruminococcus albus 8 TaxID=246199 RepID=E9SHF9_RUMAL|nr:hypothetical protein CUS_4662 [Ruminococcus albus 8]
MSFTINDITPQSLSAGCFCIEKACGNLPQALRINGEK